MTTENKDKRLSLHSDTWEELGLYVYTIADPISNEVFYVGKGRGPRVFAHERGVRNMEGALNKKEEKKEKLEELQDSSIDEHELEQSIEKIIDEKNDKIREILAAGEFPKYVIHRHALKDDKTALEVEAALIGAHKNLTNKQAGYGAKRGRLTIKEIRERYEPEVMKHPRCHGHTAMALKVKHSIGNRKSEDQSDDLYNAVRWAWKIKLKRVENVDYIFAVTDRVCRGVFVADKWAPATKEHFENKPRPKCEYDSSRYAFDGKRAPEEIRRLYVGKMLPDGYRGTQNPVRYFQKK